MQEAWPGSSSPVVGSIWNALGNSQVKKVGRSLEGVADQSHWAHSDCCLYFRRTVALGPSLPTPSPTISLGPSSQSSLSLPLSFSCSPHPTFSRENQASAMSPTAHTGNFSDRGQIRLWQGRVALRSTQNIPSAFSNHSWSVYSFCNVGAGRGGEHRQSLISGTCMVLRDDTSHPGSWPFPQHSH